MPTRKHFQAAANIIARQEDKNVRCALAIDFAAHFAAENPRFDRGLFMKACKVS